jgi:hypothetical protein
MEILIITTLVAEGILWGFTGWVILMWLGREVINAIWNVWSK